MFIELTNFANILYSKHYQTLLKQETLKQELKMAPKKLSQPKCNTCNGKLIHDNGIIYCEICGEEVN